MEPGSPWSPAVMPLSPLSLQELESQVWCLEKEATELKEAVEQQKVKNNVRAEGRPVVGNLPQTRQDGAELLLKSHHPVMLLEAEGPPSCVGRPPYPMGPSEVPELTPIGSAWVVWSSLEPLWWGHSEQVGLGHVVTLEW